MGNPLLSWPNEWYGRALPKPSTSVGNGRSGCMAYDVRRALVLGGGGVAGVAWEAGMLSGLREAGVDLTTADLIVGTSAGSIVGSFVGHDVDAAEAIDRIAADAEADPAADAEVDMDAVMNAFAI